MGFGLLFIGYLFMFSFTSHGVDILPDVIGFTISFFGVKNLADYGCGWDRLKKYYYALLPISLATLVLQVLCSVKPGLIDISIWSNYIYLPAILFYNILLFVAVYKIAEDVEMGSIKIKAQRNLIITVIYFVVMYIFDLPFNSMQDILMSLKEQYYVSAFLYLLGYIWLFLNLAVIFSCYMWICEQGDEDMPTKEEKEKRRRKMEKGG